MNRFKLILVSALLAVMLAVPGYAMSTYNGHESSSYDSSSYSQVNGVVQPVNDWDRDHRRYHRHDSRYYNDGRYSHGYYRSYYLPSPHHRGFHYDRNYQNHHYYRSYRPGFEFHIGF